MTAVEKDCEFDMILEVDKILRFRLYLKRFIMMFKIFGKMVFRKKGCPILNHYEFNLMWTNREQLSAKIGSTFLTSG